MSVTDNLNLRLSYLGGDAIGRINKGKVNGLRAAIKNSYQSANILNLQNTTTYSCLINPDSVEPDYDNKVISIEFSAEVQPGTTFYWPATNTYWLVYLQELTETAYFKGYIRLCKHKIVINNAEYYIYVKGPTEGDIAWGGSSDIIANDLNRSLTIYISKTEDTLDFFKRFNTLQLDGHTWRIGNTDSISINNIIEATLLEHYDNEWAASEVQEVEPINTTVPHILGNIFVKPYDIVTYAAVLMEGGTWAVSNSKATILEQTGVEAKVEITTGRSGQFNLIYSRAGESDVVLPITIESL